MQKILVSGSLAYDYLYTFPGVFQDELISGSSGALSVAFNVTEKTVHFGGCAGNICFNGKLLGENSALLGIAGHDFGDYKKWLGKHGVDTNHVIGEMSEFTAQASVVTDQKGQQITFFHEGAASKSASHRHQIRKTVSDLSSNLKLAIVSPNNRDFILSSVEACRENNIPYFFDPGQAMPVFTENELLHMVNTAAGLFLNEYELSLLTKQLNMPLQEILRICPIIIITLGEKGSKIYFGEKEILISAMKPKQIKDPTGCGDAYRAGFLKGIQDTFPKLTLEILEEAAQLGTKLATACLAVVGTQNHTL